MTIELVLLVSVLCGWTLGIASLVILLKTVAPQLEDIRRLIDLIASVRGYRDEVDASHARRRSEPTAPPPPVDLGMHPYSEEVPVE